MAGSGEPGRRFALRGIALILLGLSVSVTLAADAPPPAEPSDYRVDDYRSPTPRTLQGAVVLSSADAMALWKAKAARFIDVMPRARRPDNLPPETLWHVPDHLAIPGSAWLANTGTGVLAPAAAAYFQEQLHGLTAGDRTAPLVFYCQRNCWMSWNAAKRAIALGYARVHWFPDGADGWTEIGGALTPVTPAEPAP